MSTIKVEKLKKSNLMKSIILDSLKKSLDCDDIEASEIYYSFLNQIDEIPLMKTNVEFLKLHGISSKSIKENAFVLVMPKSS